MSFIDDIKFQYFGAKIYEATPIGTLTLRQFLESHKNPKDSTVQVIEQIKLAAKNNDLKLKDSLKQNNLYSFVPSVLLDGKGRAYSNIVDFNAVMMCEFDKIDHAKELKERLFNNLKSVIATWISPSGRGLKLLIRIPKPKSIEEYKQYYCGLAYYLSQYEGFDSANYNLCLPLFLSYDREILIREDAEEWTVRGGKINAFKVYEGEYNVPEEIDEEMKQKLIDKITYLIEKIEDNGHTQLIASSTYFGGLCAYYGFPLEEADDLLCELIENNNYLQKNTRGYCKSSRDMLRRGYVNPIELC